MPIKRRSGARKAAESVADTDYRKKRKTKVEFLTTGSTMLNLALTSNPDWGVPRARVTNLVGDGSSGKTAIALETVYEYIIGIESIESKLFPPVRRFRAIYNNGEGVMDFPLEKMYGPKFEEMIDWRRSATVEALGRDYLNEANALKKGESMLYVIDSWDQFKSIHDTKIEKEKDEDVLKGYKLKKQQYAWKFFASVCDMINNNEKDATLLVISQTRQKIGITFGKKQYRTGGDALNFYTHLVPWIRVVEKVDKTRKGEKRIFCTRNEVKVERSKVSKPFRTAQFHVLFDYGLDDIASMAHYLKSHKYEKWRGIKLNDMHAFSVEVEKGKLKKKLRKKVTSIWQSVEDEFEKELDQRQRKLI